MKWTSSLAAGLGLTLTATAALALPSMLPAFNTAYKTKIPANSALSKAGCAICHVGRTAALNPFGKDLKTKLAGSTTVTPTILQKIEALDSDKDGLTNIDEIKKGTLPGDDKSK